MEGKGLDISSQKIYKGRQAALEKMLHVIGKIQNQNCNEVLLHVNPLGQLYLKVKHIMKLEPSYMDNGF